MSETVDHMIWIQWRFRKTVAQALCHINTATPLLESAGDQNTATHWVYRLPHLLLALDWTRPQNAEGLEHSAAVRSAWIQLGLTASAASEVGWLCTTRFQSWCYLSSNEHYCERSPKLSMVTATETCAECLLKGLNSSAEVSAGAACKSSIQILQHIKPYRSPATFLSLRFPLTTTKEAKENVEKYRMNSVQGRIKWKRNFQTQQYVNNREISHIHTYTKKKRW